VLGYFLNSFTKAEEIIRRLALPNLKLQFDAYHRQIIHGDVTMGFRAQAPISGHIQIASIPSRQFEEFDRSGYGGFVGCEYRPRAGTREGLGWFRALMRKA